MSNSGTIQGGINVIFWKHPSLQSQVGFEERKDIGLTTPFNPGFMFQCSDLRSRTHPGVRFLGVVSGGLWQEALPMRYPFTAAANHYGREDGLSIARVRGPPAVHPRATNPPRGGALWGASAAAAGLSTGLWDVPVRIASGGRSLGTPTGASDNPPSGPHSQAYLILSLHPQSDLIGFNWTLKSHNTESAQDLIAGRIIRNYPKH